MVLRLTRLTNKEGKMPESLVQTNSKTALGATYDAQNKCVNFALCSKNATKVFLCIFKEPKGADAVMNLVMKKRENSNIWETSVKTYALGDLKEPIFYGFRIFGPNFEYQENFEIGSDIGFKTRIDEEGNRFNPNKLAFDPYCREISHLPSDVCPSLEIFRSGGELNFQDNAKLAPKSVFWLDENFEPIKITPRAFCKEIIGEVHIKDLTRTLNSEFSGTYLGAKEFAPALRDMGFTMIEFLPLCEFDHREDGQNHWGYMTLDFFAPARRYSHDKSFTKPLSEFREMVNEFHKNGLKVCLDVVYNHTGEARIHYHHNDDASLMNFALIDNANYYKLSQGECEEYSGKYYRANSGCHNDTDVTKEGFYNLVADSVAFWAKQGVDAFRFDLAVSLMDIGNEKEVYDKNSSLAGKLTEELQRRGIKVITNSNEAQEGIMLIAEPWTCGGQNCYQLGNFPDNWLEWNDVSRDTIRRAGLFGEQINLFDIRNIFEGTKTKFGERFGAINFISCHDGFSLYDLNSFKQRDKNTTGGSDWEICSDNDNDEDKKENAIKKELSILFLSKGVPMIGVGDMVMHSKCGNNNSYNRDDETNYIDYSPIYKENSFEKRIFDFTKNLMGLRKQSALLTSIDFEKKLKYFDDKAQEIEYDNENFWLDYSKNYFGIQAQNETEGYFFAISKSKEDEPIRLPQASFGKNWYILFDTSNKEHTNFEPKAFFGLEYKLNPNSIVVFKQL